MHSLTTTQSESASGHKSLENTVTKQINEDSKIKFRRLVVIDVFIHIGLIKNFQILWGSALLR